MAGTNDWRIPMVNPCWPVVAPLPPGARIGANGRILFNAPGTRLVMQVAGKIGTLNRVGIVWGVDPLANEVAGRLVVGHHANLTPIRYNTIEQTLSGDLSGVLRDFPRLRPLQQKWVAVAKSSEDRTNCFVVRLGEPLHMGHCDTHTG